MRRLFFIILVSCPFLFKAQKPERFIDSLQQKINTESSTAVRLELQATLLLKYYTTGNTAKALSFYNTAIQKASGPEFEKAKAMLLHTRGVIFYYESRFDSALFYFERALEIRTHIADNEGILKSTSNIGSIYYMMGNHKKALYYYEIGQKKESELNYPEGEYISINNLGYIHHSLKLHDIALAYFRKAEKLYSSQKKSAELVYTYDGLFNVFADLKQSDSAMKYAARSKSLALAAGELASAAYGYVNMALCCMEQKNFPKASAFLDSAEITSAPLGDNRLRLAVTSNRAAIELRRNSPDSAMRYMDKIVTLRKELNIKNEDKDLAELFSRYYFLKKDYEKALHYYTLFDNYKDSLYSADITAQVSEMRTRYETEKKEKENILLQAESKTYQTRNRLLIIILTFIALASVAGVLAYFKIKRSNKLLAEQKAEIERQKEIVDEKQKEILDSINYAKRIQFALLASDKMLNENLPQHFVLFKPKDVVSGDFYWAGTTDENFIYVTADCTGHGVPGAFMSLLNISKLSQAVNEKGITRPDEVLNFVRSEIIKALNPEGSAEESKDGMDAIVCRLNLQQLTLEFAAANNSFYIVRNGALLTCRADKMPVGKGHNDAQEFTYNEVSLQKDDMIYTFTDGYADQFGGEKGKKFKYKQLEDFFVSISHLPLHEQKEKLDSAFENWKGKLEQVDDVCILGVRV